MKTLLTTSLMLILALFPIAVLIAQSDFNVTIPTIDKYDHKCKPEKADVSFSISIRVTSNISDTCAILSIN